MIELNAQELRDLTISSSLEWLETNGIGGYASGTLSGAHTRRYHGHLVAATKPPLARCVLLSKFEEKVVVDGQTLEISTNKFPGTVWPEGFLLLTSFRLDPYPIWTFQTRGLKIERRLLMISGENTTLLSWAVVEGSGSATLELKPLFAFRSHHHLQHETADIDPNFTAEPGKLSFAPFPDMPRLYLANNAEAVDSAGHWYKNFEYAIEKERGFDFSEDLFVPCVMRFDLARPALVIASTVDHDLADAASLEPAEVARRNETTASGRDEIDAMLLAASDSFIVDRGTGKTVIAGYHWFGDWGRDTMISLPGLTLSTGRAEIAREILREFGQHLSQGMLPNRFTSENETPDYNNVDATLWYFEAIRAYTDASGDIKLVADELFEKLVNVITWHLEGTRYNIRVDDDGLLNAGEKGVQLTWMDAKVGDLVITPRTGKAVEIQALWYNAVSIMEAYAAELGSKDYRTRFATLAKRAKASFEPAFWNDDEECLYDVVNGGEKDASVRPNQIFAVSLRYPILSGERAKKVVDKVQRELLTPFGLRTLSPKDPKYTPNYVGGPLERDSAYHQGTVWAWLIGPFIDAYLKVHGSGPKVLDNARKMIVDLEFHLGDTMLAQISEIFDGDSPHKARGAAAQAWSVAELLRIRRKLAEIQLTGDAK